MKGKPNKKEKLLYLVSAITLFVLGSVASSSYGAGTLTSYLAMVGAIVVALAISYGMLKLLFKSDLNTDGDELKFDEMAADKNEIDKKY